MSEDQRRLLADNETADDLDALDEQDISISPARSLTETEPLDLRIAIAFTIMGAGMLWPFNSFITANEFFHQIFQSNRQILRIYSQSITFVFTLTNLVSIVYFTKTVRNANLSRRISRAAILTTFLFAFLAVLTTAKLNAEAYFVFLMISVAISGASTGALQNGSYAIIGKYNAKCVPFLMIGQAIAGVTPAILSIAVALIDGSSGDGGNAKHDANRRAFAYFLSSSLVLASTYAANLYLQGRSDAPDGSKASDATVGESGFLGYRELLKSYHPWSIFLTFTITLAIFPSVTASVSSVLPTEEGVPFDELPQLLQPAVFVPLGFLLWNAGDLIARFLALFPTLSLEDPLKLFIASVARLLWIPILYLCNVRGSGAVIKSDIFFFFYMFLFGTTNGLLGSLVMTAAIKQAKDNEKRDAGAFMSLMLCTGLVAGSLISFAF